MLAVDDSERGGVERIVNGFGNPMLDRVPHQTGAKFWRDVGASNAGPKRALHSTLRVISQA